MFDRLRNAFSSATKSIGQRELTEKDIDNSLFDLQLGLLESDVAQEVIDDLSAKLKKELLGLKLEKDQIKEELIRLRFQTVIAEMFTKTGKVDLINKIKVKKEIKGGPFVVVFLGINGTGKTTTVAKIANLLSNYGISVVLAAADTHRAGAIEQLSEHAEKIGLKVIAQRYGADPSAVGRDAVDYGRKHYIDAVLIDTAGRMQTAKNLMDEIGKIVKVVKPDMKLFGGDSLAGNDTVNQAREFFEYTKFDGAILTKTDADAKGGSAISIVYATSKPIVYLGVGQGYDDIILFDMSKFLQSLFGKEQIIDIKNSVLRLEQASEPMAAARSEVEPFSVPQVESDTPYFVKDQRENTGLVHDHEEHERRKSGFNRFFSRRKKDKGPGIVYEETDTKKTAEEEENMQDMNGERNDQGAEKIDSKSRSGEKEDQGKGDDENIVYLTDEDIEDLK